jgi:hypothetical protein
MNESRCAEPIEAAVLADYWLAELPPAVEERVEEHLLGCGACSSRLQELITLGEGIRELARRGNLQLVLSESFLNCAARDGLRVRQYSPPEGGSVDCTVTSEDDLLIGRLAVDLARARRVDLCLCDEEGREQRRFQDVPVSPEQREVIFSEPIETARALPAIVLVFKLISVEDSGERVLGQYRFNHTPS